VDGLGRLISVCEVTSTTLLVGITPAPGSCGQTIAATGFLTNYQYDVLGNLQTVTQGGLTARTFTYNSLSQLLTANNPESGTTSYGYDSEGNLTSRTRPAPNQTNAGTTVTTNYSPDALHRTTAIAYSDGATPSSSFQYDQSSVSGQSPQNPIGRLTYETSANGNAGAVFSYDTMGRVLNEWECTPQNCGTSSFPVAFGYDFAGGLTSLSNGVGTTFTYAVNREQRPTTLTSNYVQNGNPATMFSAVHYDGFGSVLTASLGNGVNETYAYVPRGWLQSVAAGGSGMVNHPATPGADSVTVGGSEKSINNPATPGKGTVTAGGTLGVYYTDPCQPKSNCPIPHYDSGYVQVTVNGFVAQATYGYTDTDVADDLNTLLNGSSSPVTSSLSGSTLTLTAKVTGVNSNYPLAVTCVSNDPTNFHPPSICGSGSGSALTGGVNATTTYDSGTVKITISGSLTASVSYNSSSNATSLASSLAAELNGTLVTAHSSGGVITITSVATGSDTDYSVALSAVSNDPSQFNPTSFSLSSSTGSHLAGGADQNITGAAYTLDMGYAGNGNVLSAEDSVNGNWTYTYDAMNRLATGACAGNATAHCPDGTATQGYKYLYDRFGNRWQQDLTAGTGPAPQYSFDANNHMIGVAYDAAGNMLNDGYHSYVYDAENRIIQVDGGSTATYTYDAEGRRVRKVAGATVDYVYDHAGRQIAEVNTSGGWTREEVYVGGRHLATYSGTTTYFHNADWLGTERVRTDVNGVVYESCQGLPYGDGQACVGGEPSPMYFTGKQRDGETNLDDFPARYYSSVQGRWLTADWSVTPEPVPYAKLGDPQSLNLYAYVDGDPTNHADPDGHACYDRNNGCGSKSWWQKLKGVFYAKGSVGAGLEVGVEGHIGKAKSPLKVGAKIGADVKSTMTVTTEGTTVSSTKEAQAGVNIGKVVIGPQTSTEDVTVKNGQPLANHEVEKSSSLVFGTEKAEGTLSKGDIGLGAEVDAVFISVGIEVGVDFDKVKELFNPDK
jgi:RHS repeat-associated protein